MHTEKPRSQLQRNVFALFGGFTLILCLIYSGMGLLVAYVVEDQLIDNLISDEARYIEQHYREHGNLPTPRLPHFTLYTSTDDTPREFREALAGKPHKAEYFTEGHQHFHLHELSAGSDAILAAEVGDLLTVSSQSERLIWLPLGAFLLTTVLALWLAYRLVQKAIRPVLNLAQEVESQAIGEQIVELSTSSRDDEIGFLARTLRRTLRELKSARKREAEFTHDVSHELRTNLAIASNTLALSQHTGLNVQQSRALGDILATMNRTVTTLLALARSESFEPTMFDLRPLQENRLLARPEIAKDQEIQLHVSLPNTLSVQGHPNLAGLLLDILLDNAIQHASEPVLHITYDGTALTFGNPVRENLCTASLFNAGVRGEPSDGFGQGLYLASRILNALDWPFSAQCSKQQFTVSVTPAPEEPS
ncbi:HAMP domain-containing histidine kinase [Microbulbifer salipaludis]|uniref:histidine kinase n=1 Tax=Microbulbifer salipaludis TaxID=187980 RepID=A0ABS3E217_9GAMM|nr:HAMP domain-containing sensor histidine kinase [Microbulbifer salipaludis]MBN8429283.1 HAMP domain-containing histidine kinase [Microbulbifer salipaludis]